MTKKIVRLEDYITASHAAHLLSLKLGRRIDPDYVRKLKGVRFHSLNRTSKLYLKSDIEAAFVRQKHIAQERV